MDFELRAAKEKYEREQRDKKEKARQRLDREKKLKEEAAKRQEAIDAAQRTRRIEEAGATLDAQQRQEEVMWLGDGIVFDKDYLGIPVPGNGDKLKLPASAFSELSSQNALDKGPMFFKVSVASERATASSSSESNAYRTEDMEANHTHAGVLEFTANEGFVEIPPHVWQNVGLASGSSSGLAKVKVCYVRLPKGTYAKLRPENPDFIDVPNHKAVLETKLRHHASMSVGDLLTVQHAGVDYGLRVMDLKPSLSVSVLETDMEVDVVGSGDNNEDGSSAQSRLLPLELGKSQNGVVPEGEYRYYKFSVDKTNGKAISSGELSLLVHLSVETSGGAADADVYIGAHPLLFPTKHNHDWSSHDKGSKVIMMTSSGREVGEGTFSIGVYGFSGTTSYQVLVEVKQAVQAPPGQKLGTRGSVSSPSSSHQQGEDGFEKCENCAQLIPHRTFALHEAYCRRHNVICKHPNCGIVLRKTEMEKHVHCGKCGQALQRDELEKHTKVFHEPLKCGCGAVLEMEQMVDHRASVCPLRQITCRFCGDMVQAGAEAENVRDRYRGLTQHESSCGSRTTPCDTCRRAIMLKEMDLHKAAAHGGPSQIESSLLSDSTPLSGQIGKITEHAGSNVRVADSQPYTPSHIECPICSRKFDGHETWQLNEHINTVHLSSQEEAASGMQVESSVVEETVNRFPFSTTKRTLSVACPICGMAVHSERDLSSHIDMVH
ncbi:ubiquitin fusion degradation protein 1 [Marchantia polymorpha subsp. ruderalis]